MIEIEFKNMITKAEYDHLARHFKAEAPKSQTNTYFDTSAQHLKNTGMSLRIRKTVNGHELTLKQPHPDGKLETNQDLAETEATAILTLKHFVKGPVLDILEEEHIPTGDLHVIGELTTHRIEFPYKGGILFLDHSTYNGREDYELEYEATAYDTGLQIFDSLLRDFKIPTRPAVSKIRRATTRY